MNKNIEAVIFDWAGTTVDYGCFAPVKAFAEVFRQAGIEPTMDEVREPMGKSPSEPDIDQLYASFEDKLLGILDEFADPKPYVLEVTARLRELGIKIGSTTGYTDEMMQIVVPKAKEAGYEPDAWFSPNSVGNAGRPYPYMIFKNMEALKVTSIDHVIKVGDTISDIKEGKNAGVYTIGVVEGSSEMGLTESEYNALPEAEKKEKADAVTIRFMDAGADAVILNMKELLEIGELNG